MACLLGASLRKQAHAQDPPTRRQGSLHGVISKVQLTPALHSRLRALRFSPDGSHILLQEESTLYVLNGSPLAIQLWFPARLALPVRFSADSSSIVLATRHMHVQRWNIVDRKLVDSRTLGAGKDCFVATLSPQGDLYACLGTQFDLSVFRVSSAEQFFTGQIGDAPGTGLPAILPLHAGLPHSEPFGYFLCGTIPPPPVEQVATASNIQLSPDGKYLLMYTPLRTAIGIDLQERKKFSLAGSIKHSSEHQRVQFLAPDRVVFVAPEKRMAPPFFRFHPIKPWQSSVLQGPRGPRAIRAICSTSSEATRMQRFSTCKRTNLSRVHQRMAATCSEARSFLTRRTPALCSLVLATIDPTFGTRAAGTTSVSENSDRISAA